MTRPPPYPSQLAARWFTEKIRGPSRPGRRARTPRGPVPDYTNCRSELTFQLPGSRPAAHVNADLVAPLEMFGRMAGDNAEGLMRYGKTRPEVTCPGSSDQS
jgi:hypothetical protein